MNGPFRLLDSNNAYPPSTLIPLRTHEPPSLSPSRPSSSRIQNILPQHITIALSHLSHILRLRRRGFEEFRVVSVGPVMGDGPGAADCGGGTEDDEEEYELWVTRAHCGWERGSKFEG